MARKLNTRQMEFAVRAAEGEPLVAAYRGVYKPANEKAPSVYQNAKRSAKHPGIAARIQELQLQLLPAPENMKQVYAHGLATVIQLCSCEDSKIRLMAAERLMAEAKEQEEKRERLEAGRAARTGESHEDIVTQLRMLYAKALPEREPPLVEEVNDGTAEGQAGEAPAEDFPQIAAAREEAEMREPEEARPEYRIVPGRFPPQRVRVR